MSAPFSPAYEYSNLVFISGQVGTNPETQIIPEDFEQQAINTFKNLLRVLNDTGLNEKNVIKTTVYLTDLSLFDQMNELYVRFFGEHKPARTTLGVSGLPQFPGDPNIFIEIDAIAGKDL